MPLTEKGEKIKGAMEKHYGPEKGEEIFYASKNKGTIKGVDATHITQPYPGGEITRTFPDDNQKMGFIKGEAPDIDKLVSACDALSARLDAFEKRQRHRKPVEVKPRNKDQMQPSDPHPKEVKRPEPRVLGG